MSKFNLQQIKIENAVTSAIADICPTTEETIQVQVTLKGYDLEKDRKFDAKVVLPHPTRKNGKLIVVGDKNLEEKAKEYGYKFYSFETVTGTSPEQAKYKKKILRNCKAAIICGLFHKHFEIKYFNDKGVTFYILKKPENLKSFYEDCLRTARFRLRESNVLSFPAGMVGMEVSKVAENIMVGLKCLCGELKKGANNVGAVYIKTSKGKPVKV